MKIVIMSLVKVHNVAFNFVSSAQLIIRQFIIMEGYIIEQIVEIMNIGKILYHTTMNNVHNVKRLNIKTDALYQHKLNRIFFIIYSRK